MNIQNKLKKIYNSYVIQRILGKRNSSKYLDPLQYIKNQESTYENYPVQYYMLNDGNCKTYACPVKLVHEIYTQQQKSIYEQQLEIAGQLLKKHNIFIS